MSAHLNVRVQIGPGSSIVTLEGLPEGAEVTGGGDTLPDALERLAHNIRARAVRAFCVTAEAEGSTDV